MGLHIAWNGPQIYMQIAATAAVIALVAWILRRA